VLRPDPNKSVPVPGVSASRKERHFAHVEAHPVGLLIFPPALALIPASGDEVWNRTFLHGFGLCWICLLLERADSEDYLWTGVAIY
jgi:hypothetical protein